MRINWWDEDMPVGVPHFSTTGSWLDAEEAQQS